MKILQDIYEIMPIKVKIDKGLNGVTISTKLEDNLFYAKLNIPLLLLNYLLEFVVSYKNIQKREKSGARN